jgi:hypothetical protein
MSLLIPDLIPVKRCGRCAGDSPLDQRLPWAVRNGIRPIEVYRCLACDHIEHFPRDEPWRAVG